MTFSVTAIWYGCSSEKREYDRPVAVVTYPQQAALLRPLIGDDYDLVILLPPGNDPETYDPSMSTMKALTRADIYFTMGTPGFEQAVLKRIESNFPDVKVFDASKGINRLEDSHGHVHSHVGHVHEDVRDTHCQSGDPHLLTSVRNGRIMADNMARTLTSLNNGKSEVYKSRFNRLDSILRVADDSLAALLRSGSGTFVVKHPSLSYFAQDYNLTQISLEQEGKEPSPRGYRETLKRIESESPAVIISEKQHSSRNLDEAAKSMSIPVIEVDLNTEDWIETLFFIAESIGNE